MKYKRGRVEKVLLSIIAIIIAVIFLIMLVLYLESPGKVKPFVDENNKVIKNSISEKTFVEINGVQQGMIIKGRNIDNPIILFVHGGPGMPEYFLADKYFDKIYDNFTICFWEQRDCGMSYNKDIDPAAVTVEVLVDDISAVAQYLENRFNQQKIYLMGHSWGSFIGIQAAAEKPELYYSYIGIGQEVNYVESERRNYEYLIDYYSDKNDTSMVKKLQKYDVLGSDEGLNQYLSSPIRDNAMHNAGVGTMHKMNSVFTGIFLPVMGCNAYTVTEKINLWKAKNLLNQNSALSEECKNTDLFEKVSELKIPVYFCSGKYDYTVNVDLSQEYYEKIKAPKKDFFLFEHSAHSPCFEEEDNFIEVLLNICQ